MSNPFGPGGEFAANIRTIGGDDTELRESLKAFGWVPEFPALVDENDVVLVGNRRMQIAKELGIEPVTETVNCGKGSEADARRFKLAIASNVGFQAMSAADRKRIAHHLYGNQEWTMQRIADALGTTKKTISKDLDELLPQVTIKLQRKTTTNPKGAGRPKGAPKPKVTLKPERRINTKPDAEAAAKAILDEGKTYGEMEAATGLSSTVLRSAIAREEGRREIASQPAPLNPDAMPFTMAQRYEATLKRARKEIREELTVEVTTELHAAYQDMVTRYRARVAEADRITASHRGVFSRQDYRKILACLHPDHNTFAFAAEAMQAFSRQERVLVKPDPPVRNPNTPPLPTFAEMMASGERVKAERKAAREAQKAKRAAANAGAV